MARKTLKRAGYTPPSGAPRGDAPGGLGTPGKPRGNRTGDMRMANVWNQNVRRYPSAPFGRYEDGSPLPENFDRPAGRVKRAARPDQYPIPKANANPFAPRKRYNS